MEPSRHYISYVDPSSPGGRAGLQEGDFILEINFQSVLQTSIDCVLQLIKDSAHIVVITVARPRPPISESKLSLPLANGRGG